MRRSISGGFAALGHLSHRFNQFDSCLSRRRLRSRPNHHVGQSKKDVELLAVLRQSATPHFPMPE